MNRGFVFKLGTIGLLILLLLIPLLRIHGLIEERQALRDQVVQDIARSSSYGQKLTGPLLVVPYHKKVREWREDPATKQRSVFEHEIAGQLYFLPELFKLDGKLQTEVRARGIYQARLYHSTNRIEGYFELPPLFGLEDFGDYRFEPAFVSMGISDIRGIENDLAVRVNGQLLRFQPGSRSDLLGSGVHAQVPQLVATNTMRLEFAIDLKLQGTGQFDVTPVGRETQVGLASNWPHPNFGGEFLPTERTISENGFEAHWRASFFATNLQELLDACVQKAACQEFKARYFGVGLVDPVDQYLKSERATKYALLFIALTFAGFFLFEVLKKLAVHPIQYGLVGLALAVFYLLLLSLSEHIGFGAAYAVSSVASVSLIGFYISSVLAGTLRGIGFSAGLGALYAVLYCLLNAEDYALLLGSILLFVLLSAVMVLTRKVNWFALTVKQAVN